MYQYAHSETNVKHADPSMPERMFCFFRDVICLNPTAWPSKETRTLNRLKGKCNRCHSVKYVSVLDLYILYLIGRRTHTHTHTRSGCASVCMFGMLLEEIYAQARFSTLVRGE